VSIAFSPNHGALVQVFASGELRVILLPNVALLPFTSLMTKTPLPEPGTETNEIVLAYSYTLLAALERATDPWDLLKLLSYYAFQCDLTPSGIFFFFGHVFFQTWTRFRLCGQGCCTLLELLSHALQGSRITHVLVHAYADLWVRISLSIFFFLKILKKIFLKICSFTGCLCDGLVCSRANPVHT